MSKAWDIAVVPRLAFFEDPFWCPRLNYNSSTFLVITILEMQAANRLQTALRTGSGLSFGAWQMLPGTNLSRTIARCGYDWIAVDTEHGNIDGTAIEA